MSEDEKAELVAYLDGELDEASTQAVEAKIAADPAVRSELEMLKQTWGMLDYLPKATPSANFTNRTMERMTLERAASPTKTAPMASRQRAWPIGATWAAAILLALVAGYYSAAQLWPAPPDIEAIPEADLPLVQHLRLAEKWYYYDNVDDLDFVKKLSQPDLFGDDPS
jgi:anti-sigma factor RsiW